IERYLARGKWLPRRRDNKNVGVAISIETLFGERFGFVRDLRDLNAILNGHDVNHIPLIFMKKEHAVRDIATHVSLRLRHHVRGVAAPSHLACVSPSAAAPTPRI